VDTPRFLPTRAAPDRATAAVQTLGGPSVLSGEQALQDLLFASYEDVGYVCQDFELYQGDGEHDVGTFTVIEARINDGVREFMDKSKRNRARRRRIRQVKKHSMGAADPRRSCCFQTDRVLLLFRLWSPHDLEFETGVAALESVAGPPEELD
jgi:hypothetical protein